jgi:hypothetical protein
MHIGLFRKEYIMDTSKENLMWLIERCSEDGIGNEQITPIVNDLIAEVFSLQTELARLRYIMEENQ